MENIKLDIGFCTCGSAQIKLFPNERIVPIYEGDLYIKYSNDELLSKSKGFRAMEIPEIPITAFQEAACKLGEDADFQKRLARASPRCDIQMVGQVSTKFRKLFEGAINIASMLGIAQGEVTNYHFAHYILYHLANDIPTLAEIKLWHTLIAFINIDRVNFCIGMQDFLDYDNPPAIHEMARESGVSLTSFKNKCTEYLNMTPHKWLIKQQLQRAYVLTLTSNRSIGEIGPLCKFDNNSHFIKLFKREFGVTPLSLRQAAEVFDTKN